MNDFKKFGVGGTLVKVLTLTNRFFGGAGLYVSAKPPTPKTLKLVTDPEGSVIVSHKNLYRLSGLKGQDVFQINKMPFADRNRAKSAEDRVAL